MKATPRKHAYADSDNEAPVGSLAKGFSDRFSLESSGTSDTRRQTHSTIKSRKTPSNNKEPTYLRRSIRLDNRSTTREKARRERSKYKRKRLKLNERSEEADLSKDMSGPEIPPELRRSWFGVTSRILEKLLGDEGLCSGGTKMNSIFITAKKTYNNDKNLSEIQLEHEKEDEFVVVVVKEIVSRLLEEEEKLEWWFEQDIDKEEERFEGDEYGGELEDVGRRVKIQKKRKKCFETERKDWDEKIRHHFPRWNHPMDEMTMDDLEWRRRS
ncbi:hypothetical protein Tco_0736105 [Tanacetum coccineum]